MSYEQKIRDAAETITRSAGELMVLHRHGERNGTDPDDVAAVEAESIGRRQLAADLLAGLPPMAVAIARKPPHEPGSPA